MYVYMTHIRAYTSVDILQYMLNYTYIYCYAGSLMSKFACKYIVYIVFLDYLDCLDYLDYRDYSDYFDHLFNFDCRCKSDFKGGKDVSLIGQGFQNIMDSYFW